MKRPRKTTPKVRNGKVQQKNRHRKTKQMPDVRRLPPGRGFTHVLRPSDVEAFIDLLPDWNELAKGLETVILGPGDPESFGWYSDGFIQLNALPDDRCACVDRLFLDDSAFILNRLGIASEPHPETDDCFLLHFDEESARAFMLLDVFLHELGHHHDSLTTKDKSVARGEPYAEQYAEQYADQIWHDYQTRFRYQPR